MYPAAYGTGERMRRQIEICMPAKDTKQAEQCIEQMNGSDSSLKPSTVILFATEADQRWDKRISIALV